MTHPSKKIYPCGSWPSPIKTSLLTGSTRRLGNMLLHNGNIWWIESKPQEKGRNTIFCERQGVCEEWLPAPFNARTSVHEYGGAPFTLGQDVLYFCNHADQKIYRQSAAGALPVPLSDEPAIRYADLQPDMQRNRLLLIREDHRIPNREPQNTLAALPLDGGPTATRILHSGYSFYSSPALSPDGSKLAWLCWNHPLLPWDGCELWLADLDEAGDLHNARRIAGGESESIFQPQWSPDGLLCYASDQAGWWNLYRYDNGQCMPLLLMQAEFALPHWVFGMSTWGFVDKRTIAAIFTRNGLWEIGLLTIASGRLEQLSLPGYTWLDQLRCDADGRIACYAAGPCRTSELLEIPRGNHPPRIVRRESEELLPADWVSVPESITFPSAGERIQAFFYPPQNPYVMADSSEKPPLIVLVHGGPTAATANILNLKVQYWSSRGFAVLDMNYRGSTGFGRRFRELLDGSWGVADVEDCVNGARFLAESGRVDKHRLLIRGGSAGGFTALNALVQHDVFKAATVLYGVSDLQSLSEDTHKFEARYNDRLIGPWPQARELYRERSPLTHAAKIQVPVIFFQGLQDAIVLPAQSQDMVQRLQQNGVAVQYICYSEEGHGFRDPATIADSLRREWCFYGEVLGFAVPEEEPGR